MPNQSERKSLNTDLLSRYENQRVGSAFDAKKFDSNEMGLQEKIWTKNGFVPAVLEELGFGGAKKYDKSIFLVGFSAQRYKR
jgi:hypothetical protein